MRRINGRSNRLTLQGALRYERAWSHFPAGQGAGGPDKFHASPQVFPEVVGVPGFNDLVARGGGAYDLFGNGKTSLKVNIGKYLQAANNQDRYTVGNPANSFQQTTARNWVDGNGNYSPDCDLMNPAAQDNRAAGGDFCSQWLSPNFGSPQSVSEINPAILEGWGVQAVRLAVRRVGAARDPAAHIAGSRLSPPLVPGIHGDRQSRAGTVRLRSGHLHGAIRSAAARWRWIPG